ncbi:Major Facilitator Superfamily protein [Streptomyces sp. TLI_053]|uniref:MFS transporter n=1 Tax=Streptomyces sp. TLI_053 TaxID=1855352 RepID=UPI000879DDD8|nr:MFS transporter [Streptomyces sp. TLI_053]SDT80417.1 Major Facilitator Superfamily protein [Streptomyces sp. TLI_053]
MTGSGQPGGRPGAGFHGLMAALLASSAGIGLVFPLTSIYISDRLGLGGTGAGTYFVAMAAAGCAAAVLGGPRADRGSAAAVGAVGTTSLVLSYALLGAAGGSLPVTASGLLAGVGYGLQYAAITGVVTALVPAAQQRRAFVLRHVMTNAGMGLGATGGGLLLAAGHPAGTLPWLYEAAAAASVPLAVLFLLVHRRRPAVPAVPGVPGVPDVPGGVAPDREPDPPGYRALLRSRPIALLMLAQALFATAGFTQIEATVPLLLHHGMGIGLAGVSAVTAGNALVLLLLQRPVARRLEGLAEEAALIAAPLLWCAAFGAGALATATDGAARTALLAGFAALFAIGEIAYSSAFFPLLVRFSGPASLGRGSALSSLAWSTGTAVGPPLGIAVVTATGTGTGWLALAAGAAAVLAVTLLLRHAAR